MKLPSVTPPSLLRLESVSGRFPGAVAGRQVSLSLLNALAFFFFPLRVSSYLRKSLRVDVRKDCLLRFEEIS